jgi:signal transduction histidine kinase
LDAVKRCARITHQLLGFARKFDVSVQKVHLGELVNNVLDLHQKEAEYRNIAVNVDISDDTPEIISDRGKLQQILVNLINNAFHAVSDGCQLDIRIDNLLPDQVRIAIRDNGCGISAEDINKIFEPFFTTKSAEKGSGLGLYITYGLVTKLGGDIAVQSKQHQGTTFTITLPIRLKEEIGIEGPIGRR